MASAWHPGTGRPRPSPSRTAPTRTESGAVPRVSSTVNPAQGQQLHAVHVLSTAAGAHVSSLAGGLVARGVEVTVCAPAAAESDYSFAGTGARFVPVDLGRRTATDAPAVATLRAV